MTLSMLVLVRGVGYEEYSCWFWLMILRCSNEDDDLVLGAFLFIHLDMYEEYEVRL